MQKVYNISHQICNFQNLMVNKVNCKKSRYW